MIILKKGETDVIPQSETNSMTSARVSKVIVTKSPYAVAYVAGRPDPVTFSLDTDRKVWKEEELPQTGTMVILGDLRKNDHGWRAFFARFLRPEDENQSN